MVRPNKYLRRTNFLIAVASGLLAVVYTVLVFSKLAGLDLNPNKFSSNLTLFGKKQDTEETIKTWPLYFTGDVMLARHVEKLISKNDVQPKDFSLLFASSSAVVVNFESAMAVPHVPVRSGEMRFSVATSSLPLLNYLSVTHASLANNHSRDYGLAGYSQAVEQLALRDIKTFGDAVTISTSSVSFLDYDETKVSVVGVHTLFKRPSEEELKAVMSYALASSDVVVVYIHWGEEYELVHSELQEQLARKLIALGADVIVGHHPHVTQDIDYIDGVPVFYSLGNFVFDQYFSPDVKEGYVLGMDISEDILRFTIYPHYQCELSTPCLMSLKEGDVYIGKLAERSASTLHGQIMARNIEIKRR